MPDTSLLSVKLIIQLILGDHGGWTAKDIFFIYLHFQPSNKSNSKLGHYKKLKNAKKCPKKMVLKTFAILNCQARSFFLFFLMNGKLILGDQGGWKTKDICLNHLNFNPLKKLYKVGPVYKTKNAWKVQENLSWKPNQNLWKEKKL